MKETKASFNLVDEPWIKAKTLTGETVELSLLELYRDAHKLKSLANDLPTQDFAIVRILLAILQRSIVDRLGAYEYPSDAWGDLWNAGKMPIDEIEDYLRKWRHRFDLFDEEQPFMQVAGMRPSSDKDFSDDIRPLLCVSKHKPQLFPLKTRESLTCISYADAARWLIHVQAFDIAGNKTGVIDDPKVKKGPRSTKGSAWAGRLGCVYFEGNNLAETLLLNLCLCRDCRLEQYEMIDVNNDLPVWEQAQKTPGDDYREPRGYADIYTWQSRRVLLKESSGMVSKVILTCGDELDVYNNTAFEPMTAWKRDPTKEKQLRRTPIYTPLAHHWGRTMWRGLISVLPSTKTCDDDQLLIPGSMLWIGLLASRNGGKIINHEYMLCIHSVGIEYGNNNSVISDVINDKYFIKSVLLSSEGADAIELIKQCIAATDNAVMALGQLVDGIELAAGIDSNLIEKQGRKKVPKKSDIAKSEAYFELSAAFRTWLLQLGPSALLEQKYRWHSRARRIINSIARRVVDDSSSFALQGRLVKHVRPDLKKREEWLSVCKVESRFIDKVNEYLPIADE